MRIYALLSFTFRLVTLDQKVVFDFYFGGVNMLTTKEFWRACLIRAVRTFCQTAVSMITVGQAFIDVNWVNVLSVSGVACILSILTSLAGLPEVEGEKKEG